MAILFVALHWMMAVSGVLDKSTTFDEIAHLTGGYSYWLADDYRLDPESGILPLRWAALPLRFNDYRFPSLDQPAWREGDAWRMGDQFFYHAGNDLESMLLSGRAMIALLGAGLGLVVYAWSRSLFGPAGGILSLLLYIFCPSILAHGSLITSDLAASLTLTAAVWCFWSMLHKLTPLSVLGSSVVMGLLFVSKVSAVLIIPMALALAAIRLVAWRSKALGDAHSKEAERPQVQPSALVMAAAVHLVIVAAVVWSFYGFRYSAFGPVRYEGDRFHPGWDVVLNDSGSVGAVIEFARDHRVLPEAYLYGFVFTVQTLKQRRAFLNGRHNVEGWWYFFPYSLLVKTPLPLFAILGLALTGSVLRGRSEVTERFRPARTGIRDGLYRTAPLWILLLVYWAFALSSHINIGHRHILPTYPAMFILAGAVAGWFGTRHRIVWAMLAVCMAWLVAESVGIRPHYLAYFNQVVGGPGGAYRHLVDSSLDWGQDLPGLKRWLDRNGLGGPNKTPAYLSYFGTGSPDYYGIEALPLPSYVPRGKGELFPLTGGVYCISATMLQAIYLGARGPWQTHYENAYREVLADMERYDQTSGDMVARRRLVQENGQEFWTQRFSRYEQLRFARLLAYLRQREPDENVGHSILIYRLSEKQVREALYGPLAELEADARPQ